METPSPHRLGERGGYTGPLHGGYVPSPMMSPKEVTCSFCGVNAHGYKDCPVMHQYIREQVDALTQKRLEEYQQLREWERYESPKWVPTHQEPLHRGGGPYKRGSIPDQGSSKQGTQKQEVPVKTRMIGSMYPHVVGGMAPGGGGGTPPPSKGGPPDNKSDDGSDKEENDQSDTDEDQ